MRRGKDTQVVEMKTVGAGSGAARRPVVGISLEPALDIHLPFPVRIDAGNVGGPSAGVAFALEVMEELGRDVVHGHKIAATGEILRGRLDRPDRRASSRRRSARAQAHVDAFLVPAGENAREARKLRGRASHHPCEDFSTGVARAGNAPPERVDKLPFRPGKVAGKCTFSV